MKYTFAILALALSCAASAHAAEPKDHPCKKIEAACEAAGFTKGGHRNGNKGLFIDCMKKIKEGTAVAGVTVSPEDVTSCTARVEKRREKRAAGKIESGGKVGPGKSEPAPRN